MPRYKYVSDGARSTVSLKEPNMYGAQPFTFEKVRFFN